MKIIRAPFETVLNFSEGQGHLWKLVLGAATYWGWEGDGPPTSEQAGGSVMNKPPQTTPWHQQWPFTQNSIYS